MRLLGSFQNIRTFWTNKHHIWYIFGSVHCSTSISMHGRILFDESLFQNATEENEQTQTFSFNSHENTKQWQLRVRPNGTTLFHRIVHGIFEEGKHEELEGSQNRRTHCLLKTNPNCNWRGVGMDVARQKITVWVFARLLLWFCHWITCLLFPHQQRTFIAVFRSSSWKILWDPPASNMQRNFKSYPSPPNRYQVQPVEQECCQPDPCPSLTAAPRRKAMVRRWIILFHWSFFLEGMGIGGAVLQPAGHMLSQEQQMWHHLARGRLNSLINTSMHHNYIHAAHTLQMFPTSKMPWKHHPQ